MINYDNLEYLATFLSKYSTRTPQNQSKPNKKINHFNSTKSTYQNGTLKCLAEFAANTLLHFI